MPADTSTHFKVPNRPLAPAFQGVRPAVSFRGGLTDATLLGTQDRFEARFAGGRAPSGQPSALRRLWIAFLTLLDKVLDRHMEHIQRTVEHVGTPDRIELRRAGVNSFEAVDRQTGKVLAKVKHSENSRNDVELYMGKGGFTAVVTSPDGTKYFGLGKSRIELGDTVVETLGESIATSGNKHPAGKNTHYTRQEITPQAMILGAGLATRFEPVSGEHTLRSKPDVFLNGEQTVIQNLGNILGDCGFPELFVNTHFMPHSLKESLGKVGDCKVHYVDEKSPSGTAGALRKLLQDPGKYGFDTTKPLLIVQGDAVTDVDFGRLMRTHKNRNALVTIGCQQVDKKDVDKFGIVVTDQSGNDGVSGKITSFQEKPEQDEAKSQLANTGFYIFSPEAYPLILDAYNDLPESQRDKELDFAKHVFPKIQQKVAESGGTFWAQKVDGYWSDIGNPPQYLESVYDLFADKVNLPLPSQQSVYFENGVLYWPGARRSAELEGARLSGNVIAALPYKQA